MICPFDATRRRKQEVLGLSRSSFSTPPLEPINSSGDLIKFRTFRYPPPQYGQSRTSSLPVRPAYADLWTQMWSLWYVALVICTIATWPSKADAGCVAETLTTEIEAGLVVHLSPSCTVAEREAYAVRGEAIMEVIATGGPVDLLGVIVRGDLLFDRLAVQTASRSPITAPEIMNRADRDGGNGQRIVRGRLTLKDSVVFGAVRHRSADGTLRFEGPVNFSGSHFKDGVDLSRSVFQEPIEFSAATFDKEAYFVMGQFVKQMDCRETKFGPGTRFHRSVFHGSVNCTGALFDGMAEFLEVTFEQPATFERSRFGLGTGFSGSRFKSRVSFSEAIFSRETFFAFAAFENEAVFAGAQFLGPVDFSHAEFRRQDDLAKARFDQPPLLVQTKRFESTEPADLLQTRNGQYVFTLIVLVVAALLGAYAVKYK